jgi:hypothetical protein
MDMGCSGVRHTQSPWAWRSLPRRIMACFHDKRCYIKDVLQSTCYQHGMYLPWRAVR